ncbi:MAG: DNA recombination protein RmuC [Elusimicrobiota bacterium]
MTLIILAISIANLILIIYALYKINLAKSDNFKEETEKYYQNTISKISEEISKNRMEYSAAAKELRQEMTNTLTALSKANSEIQKGQLDSFSNNLKNFSDTQFKNLKDMDESLKKLKETIADTLKNEIRFLQEKNEKKLEEMRQTVDEKLQSTLEKRLSESFKTVSSQLENVYKGLGEMNNLAKDVGDLKKVLSNVKSRGVFGELQLKNLLEDILTKEQFEENARIKKNFSVEFAVKIPSKDDNGKHILLPIDSKFPREDYEKILDAQQKSDPVLLEKSVKALADRIKGEARDIFEKYINPPETTDFALLFLPSEGLFAEVLRIPGFFEDIRKNYNIVITGPTTITAILNSLQMGFRTLAIEKRSHEVWKVLGSVKKEFQTFGENLAKTRKKLEEAADNIEKAEKRTQIIGKKLKEVEASSAQESKAVLGLEEAEEIQEDI